MKKYTSKDLIELLTTTPPRIKEPTFIDCEHYDTRATQITLSKLITRRGFNMTTRMVNGHIWVWAARIGETS